MSQEYKNKGPIYTTKEKYEAMRTAGTLVEGREYRLTDWKAQEELVAGSNISIADDGKTISAQKTPVVDNVTSTSTTDALSANMGKTLQNEINNLKNIGRFLAVLDCSVGTVSSQPEGEVGGTYEYKVGDYYRIGNAGSYAPKTTLVFTIDSTSGNSNFEQGSTSYDIGDVIYCSNVTSSATTWVKQQSSGGGKVQDVQINGTTIVSGGTANIPEGSTSTYGVYKLRNTNYGIQNEAGIGLSVVPASTQMLIDKSAYRCPVTGSNLDIAIREGLGNNSLSWTDAYKASARNTIGAAAPVTIEFLS